ncbi:MAG: IS66-like element accessory protein TnpA [Vitreimonas sp.]
MDDRRDAARIETPRRIEILTGGGARQRWPEAMKAKLVAESLQPGVGVAELARRHGARASQIHLWRKDAREGRLVLPAAPTTFAEAVIAPPPLLPPPSRRVQPKTGAASIEIEAPKIAIRVRDGADANVVAAIIRALKP